MFRKQRKNICFFIPSVVLGALGLILGQASPGQVTIPPYATAEVIESRYSDQLDRLHELAMNPSRIGINQLSDLSLKEMQNYMQDRETQHRLNQYILSLPEILSASTMHQLTPNRGEGEIVKEDNFRRVNFEDDSSPGINNAVISIGKAKTRDGLELKVVRYKALLIHPTGHEVTYEMIFDLQALRKAARKNEEETGTQSMKARLADSFSIRGSILDQNGKPVQASVMFAEKNDKRDRGLLMDFTHPRANCDENGRFEIRYLSPSTYEIVIQKELNIGNENTVTMDVESRTVTVTDADIDLGEVIVPLESTIKKYHELGIFSPPAKIEDDRIYYVTISDHQAPTEINNMMQSEYQSIYVVDSEAYAQGRQEFLKAAKRVSGIGMRGSPIWNKSGDRIAYLDRSGEWQKSKIIVRNVSTGEEKILKDIRPDGGGISWDESGSIIAYKNANDEVCVYDLNSKSEIPVCISQAEHIALSPDSKTICFMTRDSEDRNAADGWRLNIVDTNTGKITKVGRVDDNFGLIGPFFWRPDSSSIVFSGFGLDADKRRDYAKYEYILKSGTMQKYTGDFQDVYDQRVRYWIRTMPPLCP